MAQCAASYGEAVLHAPLGALHKNAFSDEAISFRYEASPLRSAEVMNQEMKKIGIPELVREIS